jgi:hypothetical protein
MAIGRYLYPYRGHCAEITEHPSYSDGSYYMVRFLGPDDEAIATSHQYVEVSRYRVVQHHKDLGPFSWSEKAETAFRNVIDKAKRAKAEREAAKRPQITRSGYELTQEAELLRQIARARDHGRS